MTWVSWRLQRTETLVAFGILALLAAFLVPTGIQMAHAYDRDSLAACVSLNPGPTCNAGAFRQRFQSLLDLSAWFTFVPGLVGAILAAPFILDLERGTYRLAWTQSITRGRWLLGKLGTAIARCARRRRRTRPAPELVALAERAHRRASHQEHVQLGGHRHGRLHALRARPRRLQWARSGGERPPRSSSPSSAISRCACSSTTRSATNSSRRSRAQAACAGVFCRRERRAASGSSTKKVEPSPSFESTQMRPPTRRTSSRQM